VLISGVRKGIERANRILIPLLVGMFLVIVLRAVTLEGAALGLDSLFRPDWSSIGDASVWVAACGQIFFSLSIGFAIMITYASYLPRSGDLTGNAFIVGFSNASFELLAGIGVFAAIGFLATSAQVGIDEVARDGIGLVWPSAWSSPSPAPGGGSGRGSFRRADGRQAHHDACAAECGVGDPQVATVSGSHLGGDREAETRPAPVP